MIKPWPTKSKLRFAYYGCNRARILNGAIDSANLKKFNIDKIKHRTQTPYSFFGHKAFTAIYCPGDGAKSQPTGRVYLSFDFFIDNNITRPVFFLSDKFVYFTKTFR
jgi:hypothetical protein